MMLSAAPSQPAADPNRPSSAEDDREILAREPGALLRAIRVRDWLFEEARAKRLAGIPTGAYGDPADFGAACAFLCSQQARFIVGQNLLLDGGAFATSL